MTPPKQIYLQWDGDVSEEDKTLMDQEEVELESVCWCNEKVFNSDIGPFVLAEDYNKLREQLTRARSQRDRAIHLYTHRDLAHFLEVHLIDKQMKALRVEIEKEAK
jgi:hypothetical protein